MSSTHSPAQRTGRFDPRILSAFELLLGAFIVVGHNVFRVLPNEVPILAVLGLLSARLRAMADGRPRVSNVHLRGGALC